MSTLRSRHSRVWNKIAIIRTGHNNVPIVCRPAFYERQTDRQRASFHLYLTTTLTCYCHTHRTDKWRDVELYRLERTINCPRRIVCCLVKLMVSTLAHVVASCRQLMVRSGLWHSGANPRHSDQTASHFSPIMVCLKRKLELKSSVGCFPCSLIVAGPHPNKRWHGSHTHTVDMLLAWVGYQRRLSCSMAVINDSCFLCEVLPCKQMCLLLFLL